MDFTSRKVSSLPASTSCTGSVLDPKLDPIMPEVASMGASVSIVDFDRDGWSDIYVNQ